jgi:hypothetical protein
VIHELAHDVARLPPDLRGGVIVILRTALDLLQDSARAEATVVVARRRRNGNGNGNGARRRSRS